MSDLIDRQQAIDAVCMEWCGVKHQDCKHPFDDEEDDYYWCDGCETVLRTLPDLPPAQPEQQHGRIFREIVVEYPSYCTYPEYKGKPYFSIKYTENGQEFIGYGTYKPEVLSKYLKEYFMPPAQPERIRGHWIESDAQNRLMKNLIAKGETWRVCDKCGAGFMIGYQHESDKIYHETFHNFCPKCGAEMEVTK